MSLKYMEKSIVVSGFVRYRPHKKCFLLFINSRRLFNILLNQDVRAKIERVGDRFSIRADGSGNKIMVSGIQSISISIPGRAFLTKEERVRLMNKKTKKSFAAEIEIDLDSFGISQFDLYPDSDAAALARELALFDRVLLPERLLTSRNSLFDLEFKYGNLDSTVEISRVKPKGKNIMDYRHQPLGGSILAHLFDSYRRCVRKLLRENTKIPSFVIIPEGWRRYKYFFELFNEAKELGCYVLFADFDNTGWSKKTAINIVRALNMFDEDRQ